MGLLSPSKTEFKNRGLKFELYLKFLHSEVMCLHSPSETEFNNKGNNIDMCTFRFPETTK